jgi:tetratricopeptide (TPR) repeat protein
MLAAESVTAARLDQLVAQIDFLGVSLAARIDPKPAADRAGLASLMTSDLEAWRCYSVGLRNAESLQTDEAIRWFEKAVALDPNFAMALARIGYAYSVTGGKLDAGKPYLEKAFRAAGRLSERDRTHIAAWYAIASQDYQEAIRHYSELVTRYPNESEGYFRLAALLEGESRHEEALVVAHRALALDPDDPKLHNLFARLHSEMGRHREALQSAERYVALAPGDANAYDSLGLTLQFAGEYGKALDAYAKALALNPDFGVAFLHRVLAWRYMGREREALQELLRDHDPRLSVPPARFLADAAWILWRRGRLSEARAAADRAMTDPAASANMHWHPAILPGSSKALPEPERNPLYGRGARYAPRLQYFSLAEEARLRTRPAERLAHLREAVRRRAAWGSQELMEDALADALLELGRLDEAIAEYERALTVFPGMALARYRLAGAYRQKGATALAQQHYRRFLDLWKNADPDLPEVIDARRYAR